MGTTALALEDQNALDPNALNGNALNGNALNGNALNGNALNGNALNGNALNGNALDGNALTSGTLSNVFYAAIGADTATGVMLRQLLKYTVGCALKPEQSISFTWTDAFNTDHPVQNFGLLSLVPEWSARPLLPSERQWVSACLASRSNYYGVPVIISSRGPHEQLVEGTAAAEMKDFPLLEGAFWGNVYGPNPAVYACYYTPNVDHSRSKMRDCAAGHIDDDGHVVDCPAIHRVGACDDVCFGQDPVRGYYTMCASNPADPTTITDRVVTTFLPP